MRGWKDLGSDVNWSDYSGKWGKRAADGSWYVVRFDNMYDACGEYECKRGGQSQYVCEVLRVDLSQLSEKNLKSAYDCIGLDLNDVDEKYREAAQVEACVSYGCYQPLESFSGDVYAGRIRADARRYAEKCMRDDDLLADRLARPVNKIGSTAEEYGRGDFDAALLRGPFDATKQLMLKIRGVPQDAIDRLAKGEQA